MCFSFLSVCSGTSYGSRLEHAEKRCGMSITSTFLFCSFYEYNSKCRMIALSLWFREKAGVGWVHLTERRRGDQGLWPGGQRPLCQRGLRHCVFCSILQCFVVVVTRLQFRMSIESRRSALIVPRTSLSKFGDHLPCRPQCLNHIPGFFVTAVLGNFLRVTTRAR